MTRLAPTQAPAPAPARSTRSATLSPRLLLEALPGTFRKLDPRFMWRNPVMFVVEVGAALTTAYAVTEPFLGDKNSGSGHLPASFSAGIAIWLWITVLFANLAEAVAEGRGKAQAQSLRATRTSTLAHSVTAY
ncbi:MAG: potassium-transporting ATPase subunit B, partial [Pseudolysinimonas sp.]